MPLTTLRSSTAWSAIVLKSTSEMSVSWLESEMTYVSGGSADRTDRSVTRVDVRSDAARTLEFSWRSERSNGLLRRPE